MKLPHAELAVLETGKIRDYLLSASHPIGRFKAPVFHAMGYRQDQWEQLAADLREQQALSEVDEVAETQHGRKYVIRANLNGPNGRTFAMQSIWIILKGEDVPRLLLPIQERNDGVSDS